MFKHIISISIACFILFSYNGVQAETSLGEKTFKALQEARKTVLKDKKLAPNIEARIRLLMRYCKHLPGVEQEVPRKLVKVYFQTRALLAEQDASQESIKAYLEAQELVGQIGLNHGINYLVSPQESLPGYNNAPEQYNYPTIQLLYPTDLLKKEVERSLALSDELGQFIKEDTPQKRKKYLRKKLKESKEPLKFIRDNIRQPSLWANRVQELQEVRYSLIRCYDIFELPAHRKMDLLNYLLGVTHVTEQCER